MLLHTRYIRLGILAVVAFSLAAGNSLCQGQDGSAREKPYGEQIRALAGGLLKKAEKLKCRRDGCTMLVANFAMPSGSTSRFGMQLADALAEELAARGIRTVERKQLQDYLAREHISSAALQDREAARWLAAELHANVAVVGKIEELGDHYNLLTELLIVSSDKIGPQEAVPVAIPEPEKAFAAFEPYDVQRPEEKLDPGAPPLVRAGVRGVGVPSCVHCPPAQYSDAARKAKFVGTVVLEVTVTERGRASDIRVLKGVPFGLNEQAIRAIGEWTFKPASSDGQPIAVRVPIETTFRLY